MAVITAMFHRVSQHDPLRTTKNKSLAPAWLNPARIASIIAHLEDAEKTKTDMQKCINAWAKEGKMTKARIRDFVDSVVAANKECENAASEKRPLFPKYLVHSILLAFMWEQAQTKAELVPYYETLDFKVLTDDTKLNKSWQNGQFENDPFEISTEINVADQFETACYVQSMYLFFIEAPPLPRGSSLHPTCAPIASSRSDCVESALRGLVNAVVLNPHQKVFDVSRVSSNAHPIQGLLDYYNGANESNVQRNTVCSEVESTQSAQAWYDLVSMLKVLDMHRQQFWRIMNLFDTKFGDELLTRCKIYSMCCRKRFWKAYNVLYFK